MGAIFSCLCGQSSSDEEREALLQNGDGRLGRTSMEDIDANYGSGDLTHGGTLGGLPGIDYSKREQDLHLIVDATDDNLIDISALEQPENHTNLSQRPLKEFRKKFSGRRRRRDNEDEGYSDLDEEDARPDARARSKGKNRSKGSITLNSAINGRDGSGSNSDFTLPLGPNKKTQSTGRRSNGEANEAPDFNAPIAGSLDSISSSFIGKKLGRSSTETGGGALGSVSDLKRKSIETPTRHHTPKPAITSEFQVKDTMSLLFDDDWEVFPIALSDKEQKWIIERAQSAYKAFCNEAKVKGSGDLILSFA